MYMLHIFSWLLLSPMEIMYVSDGSHDFCRYLFFIYQGLRVVSCLTESLHKAFLVKMLPEGTSHAVDYECKMRIYISRFLSVNAYCRLTVILS